MLAILAAMQTEADALLCNCSVQKSLSCGGKKVYSGTGFGREFQLIVCGVGKVNAAVGAQLAIDCYNADVLLNFGVAGGITEKTKIANIFSIERAVQYDFDLSEVNHTPIGTLNEYQTPYLPCKRSEAFPSATLATGDRFSNSIADLSLLADLRADIRDMEGGAIAQVALANGVPLYMFKAISDVIGNDCVQQYKNNLTRALNALTAATATMINEVR